jgi:hypothetical protein
MRRYAAFLQNAGMVYQSTQGCTLGWYAAPRWGAGRQVTCLRQKVQSPAAGWSHEPPVKLPLYV